MAISRKEFINFIPRLPQSEQPREQQLRELVEVARRLGLELAAETIRAFLNREPLPLLQGR